MSSSSPYYKRPFQRNVLYALAALPPAIYLLSGHVLLGILFLLCVIAARFSRPAPRGHRTKTSGSANS